MNAAHAYDEISNRRAIPFLARNLVPACTGTSLPIDLLMGQQRMHLKSVCGRSDAA